MLLAKVDFAPPIAESENLEDLKDVGGYPDKDIEKIMSVIKTSSKVYKPTTYKQMISNLVYTRQWKEAIEEEIQNLENHQMWEYNYLLSNRKAVRLT